MRSLRPILQLALAIEAIGLLSATFFLLSHGQKIAAFSTRYHLGHHSLAEVAGFIVLWAAFTATAALRIGHGDRLGRWSLLAASIFNLPLFPIGTALSVAGIIYFVRNPGLDPTLARKHQPITGDGTTRWSGAIFVIAQVAWCMFILSGIGRWTAAQGMRPIRSQALFWITLAAAIYGSILFHELGHFALGDIVGFRLFGFGVGPLSCAYAKGRWRLQMRSDKLFGGHTIMIPTTPQNIRMRAMALTFGGPFASALLGAIGIVCLMLIPGPAWPAALGRTAALVTCFAIGDFIFNLIPMASEAQYSDGAKLWQLYRRGPWCNFHCAHHYMGLSQTTPLRPRDWPTDMVERAAEFATQLPEPATSFARTYAHFLDRGEWELALSWLEKAFLVARSGSKLAHSLTIDRAFLEAFHRRDPLEAQRWFDQAPANEDSTDYWRALASVQAAQGNLPAASATWSKAWEMASMRPATGIYDMDRELLRLVGVRLEQLRAQPTSA